MDETQPLLPQRTNEYRAHHPQDKTDVNYRLNFDPNGDPDNPQDWKTSYKWGVVLLLAFMAFSVTFNCIGLVPVANNIVADLDHASGRESSSAASVLLVTIWELGEAAGPLLIAPMSEVYGRYPVFNIANGLFIACTVLGALSQSTTLLIFARFFTGCAVAGNVLNPAIIGDMFPTKSRGSPMSVIMLAPLLGGAVGPAVAGLVAQTTGWREIIWISVGLATVAEILFLVLLRETYKPAILRRRAHKLGVVVRRGAKSDDTEALIDVETMHPEVSIWKSIKRPATVFASSVVLQMLSLYGAVIFAFYYVVSTTLPGILETIYAFPPTLIGASFLSFTLGSALGTIVCNSLLDYINVRLQPPHRPHQPELRLPLAIFGAFTLPLTLALYGWTADLHLPFPVLILSVALMGFTLILGLLPVTSYVVDAFGMYSASAFTAVLITRCLMSTFMPMAAQPLASVWGWGWGMCGLAAVCMALAPVPVVIFRYGGSLRERSTFTKEE
ncbi:hypothetical protein LTR91_010506 [Friedmanniomyces endolithicus]|uniref:Major facilitator superfamily (MFS) profile domain-containing protein n=1 Tax=Friedmanniomyces endolithicus TaxID=329885 RepID=A0AAN6QTG4_9PEZI|nr:hypothetical protein LTR57_001128 [Friedmanniomyces endolithicus]KAK0985770.1 hypothetical protein LTR91_010506 [Friedmanniomyces endolithicus]KAK1014709.1 hypothetical protein LTS01_000130 [Friedmanniomyces endolithicus]